MRQLQPCCAWLLLTRGVISVGSIVSSGFSSRLIQAGPGHRYLPGHGRPTRTAPAIHRSPSRADAHVAGDSGRINRKWRSRQTAHDGNRPKQPSCLRLTLSVYTDDATSRAFKGSRKARGEG